MTSSARLLCGAVLLVAVLSSVGAAPAVPLGQGGTANETLLAARRIALPVRRVDVAVLRDTFREGRTGHPHEAIDIAAPRGTRVFAVDDGQVAKLFTSAAGGLTVYQFDPERKLAYYYAHLDRYAEGVHEGAVVHRCDLLGYVGTTGNAPPDAPHLHFAVFRLGSPAQWWRGEPVNPYPFLRASADPAPTASEAPVRSCPSGRTPR